MSPTTTTVAATTTANPVTVATTQQPTTLPAPTIPPTTTTSPEPTTLPTTLPPQPASTLPSTPPAPTTPLPPEVSTRKEEETEARELVVVTQSDTDGAAITPSVVMVAVTMADGDLEPVMPLIIPPHDLDSSSLEVVTNSPPSNTHEAEGALSLAEPPTLASSDFPLPTPFPVAEPVDSQPSLDLDLTQTPTPVPTRGFQTEARSPGPDHEDPQEEVDVPAESAVQSENDTATFSAATVLSGDGEVDHTSPSFSHMVDTDLELDYQNDPADAFLPVSSAASLLLLLLLLLKASVASQCSQLLTGFLLLDQS